MKRRKQVPKWEGPCFTLWLGSTVTSKWGGQVPGQRPRTKTGEIVRLYDDGSFWAECQKTGKLFSGSALDIIQAVRPRV